MTARTAQADPSVQVPRSGRGLSDFPVMPDPVGAIPPMARVTTLFPGLPPDGSVSESSDGIPAERGSIRNPGACPSARLRDGRPGFGRARPTKHRGPRAGFSSSLAQPCGDEDRPCLAGLDGKRSEVTPLWVRHASAAARATHVLALAGGLSIAALRHGSPTLDVTGDAQDARVATARAPKPL